MSDQDRVKPFHAKDTAPGQEAADVVAEVLQHAAEREEAVRKKVGPKGPPKWTLPVTINLGVLALYFLIAQPEFLIVSPNVDRRTDAERVLGVRSTMVMVINRIEVFQIQNGRLPSTLDEAGAGIYANEGFDYSLVGDSTFLLIATVGDETVTFDSATMTDDELAPNLATQIAG